jgi:hypothetical protein
MEERVAYMRKMRHAQNISAVKLKDRFFRRADGKITVKQIYKKVCKALTRLNRIRTGSNANSCKQSSIKTCIFSQQSDYQLLEKDFVKYCAFYKNLWTYQTRITSALHENVRVSPSGKFTYHSQRSTFKYWRTH